MIVLVDNYDSFTFNLVHYLGGLGADVAVHRNDKIGVDEVLAAEARGDRAVARPLHAERGRHLPRPDRARPRRRVPILGVCLGHQSIGQAFGGKVVRAPQPVHGKLTEMRHQGAERVPRHQRPVQGDALSLAGGRARRACRRASASPRKPTTGW